LANFDMDTECRDSCVSCIIVLYSYCRVLAVDGATHRASAVLPDLRRTSGPDRRAYASRRFAKSKRRAGESFEWMLGWKKERKNFRHVLNTLQSLDRERQLLLGRRWPTVKPFPVGTWCAGHWERRRPGFLEHAAPLLALRRSRAGRWAGHWAAPLLRLRSPRGKRRAENPLAGSSAAASDGRVGPGPRAQDRGRPCISTPSRLPSFGTHNRNNSAKNGHCPLRPLLDPTGSAEISLFQASGYQGCRGIRVPLSRASRRYTALGISLSKSDVNAGAPPAQRQPAVGSLGNSRACHGVSPSCSGCHAPGANPLKPLRKYAAPVPALR
jgi:hypothetical protein